MRAPLIMASRAPVGGFQRLSSALSSAALEWMLMLLLFFDALFVYLVTRFSRLCMLQKPCMFCSRLDHVFGNEKRSFYLDLICETHRSEISLLGCSNGHEKLADVHTVCQGCFRSFDTEGTSNSETYKSLVGELKGHLEDGEDVQDIDGLHLFHGDELANVPFLKKDDELHAIKSLEDKSIRVDVSEVDISLSSSNGHSYLQNKDGARKTREKTLVSPAYQYSKNQEHDHFSHVGYSEVKITSDSDSDLEIQFTDDDEGNSPSHRAETVMYDLVSHVEESEGVTLIKNDLSGSVSGERATEKLIRADQISVSDAKPLEKLTDPAPVISDPFESIPEKQRNADNLKFSDAAYGQTTTIDDAKDCCTTDINLRTSHDAKFSVSDDKALEKLMHSDPVITEPSESISENQTNVGELQDASTFSSSGAAGHFLEDSNCNQIEVKAIPPQSEFVPQDSQEVLLEDSNVKACTGTTSVDDAKDWCTTNIDLGTSHDASDPGQSMSTRMDLNDAYKIAVGDKGSLSSPRFTDVIIGRDSSRVQEDLKLLISQISAAQGLESPWNEMSPSPRVYGQGDEYILQNITKTLSLERNESGLESLDGSIVSEVEGESPVERLKRQVELDRKSISLLFKELEEERSASAIAANQAMAMITRLQEEKAAMHMEALQYQRMMEEQAEYDHEALQKCNKLLTQREKMIQGLEAEVESLRICFVEGLSTDNSVEQSDNFHDKEIASWNKSGEPHVTCQNSRWSEFGDLKDPLSCFEDEEAYILNCLTKLEKKLHLFSNNGVYDDSSSFNLNADDENGLPDKTCGDVDGEFFVERNVVSEGGVGTNGQIFDEVQVSSQEKIYQKDGPPENIQVGENIMMEEKISGKSSSSSEGNRGDSYDIDKQKLLKVGNKNELVALENEVSRLSQRLEALEADRNFLEHAINSLRSGNNGVQIIQEIACDLRELRRIAITR
uniref:GTD-binding domain-containing protein n=1 Tax=Musa acuminata subsp. malaccensis TaxID=214687 RepID=A0A804JR23_MUSAM|nr:PREDICTED: myosin-binding protein 1-like isoform X2 [Musa acuminata subsp. malaccensis]